MGIKCLLKFLKDFPEVVKNKNFSDYKNKKIAIDISIILYQSIIAIRNTGADLKNNKGEITSHILGLFNKTILLIRRGIIPVYVFDGRPIKLKSKVLDSRRSTKNKAEEKMLKATTIEDKIKYFKRMCSISKKQYNDCMELLDLMGIPYIIAPEEADSQCAYLVKKGLVDSVLTDDMDILTFGSNKIVKNLASYKNKPIEICLDDILKNIDLTYKEFVELCILFGCDYCSGITDIKYNDIYKYFIKYKNIKDTIIKFKEDAINVPNCFLDETYNKVKEYFITGNKYKEINKDYLELKKPKQLELEQLLVNNYGLIKYRIQKKLYDLYLNYPNYKETII